MNRREFVQTISVLAATTVVPVQANASNASKGLGGLWFFDDNRDLKFIGPIIGIHETASLKRGGSEAKSLAAISHQGVYPQFLRETEFVIAGSESKRSGPKTERMISWKGCCMRIQKTDSNDPASSRLIRVLLVTRNCRHQIQWTGDACIAPTR